MNNIDNLFKDKLKQHSIDPSNQLWDRLNGELDKKDRKPILFWFSIAAGLLIFCGVSVFLFSVYQNDNQNPSRISSINKLKRKYLLPTDQSDLRNLVANKKIELLTFPVPQIETRQKKKHNNVNSIQIPESPEVAKERIKQKSQKEYQNQIDASPIPSSEDVAKLESEKTQSIGDLTIIIKRGNNFFIQSSDSALRNPSIASKLKNAYAQVLNFKNGDKVEVEEFSGILASNKKEKQTQNKLDN